MPTGIVSRVEGYEHFAALGHHRLATAMEIASSLKSPTQAPYQTTTRVIETCALGMLHCTTATSLVILRRKNTHEIRCPAGLRNATLRNTPPWQPRGRRARHSRHGTPRRHHHFLGPWCTNNWKPIKRQRSAPRCRGSRARCRFIILRR